MEIYGIMLSVPAAFAVTAVYGKFILKYKGLSASARRFLYSASLVLLVCFGIELALVGGIGPVRSRTLFGPAFSVAHLALFFLAVPAMCNALLLGPERTRVTNVYVAAAICAAFALVVVLLQYSVSEALYGLDGSSGPFS